MEYGCFMDWEAKREKICFLGSNGGGIGDVGDPEDSGADTLVDNGVKIPEDDGVEVQEAAPLYTSLCDVMGLDLYQTMVEIGNSERPQETAAQYSYLFLNMEFLDAYQFLEGVSGAESGGKDFTELRGLFDWLHYLKAWFVGMQKDERLRDPEKFRSYAEHMLGTSIPVQQPRENDPADFRQKLDPAEPDYKSVTDAFL